MLRLDHPNVISLLGVCLERPALVLQLAQLDAVAALSQVGCSQLPLCHLPFAINNLQMQAAEVLRVWHVKHKAQGKSAHACLRSAHHVRLT